jgi:hypothetical protein
VTNSCKHSSLLRYGKNIAVKCFIVLVPDYYKTKSITAVKSFIARGQAFTTPCLGDLKLRQFSLEMSRCTYEKDSVFLYQRSSLANILFSIYMTLMVLALLTGDEIWLNYQSCSVDRTATKSTKCKFCQTISFFTKFGNLSFLEKPIGWVRESLLNGKDQYG